MSIFHVTGLRAEGLIDPRGDRRGGAGDRAVSLGFRLGRRFPQPPSSVRRRTAGEPGAGLLAGQNPERPG